MVFDLEKEEFCPVSILYKYHISQNLKFDAFGDGSVSILYKYHISRHINRLKELAKLPSVDPL